MRVFALLLTLTFTGLLGAEQAKPAGAASAPAVKPLPDEKTKLPWHMVNLW